MAHLGLPSLNFIYSGDEWDSSSAGFDTEKALDRYRADYARMVIDDMPPPEASAVTLLVW